ncbi:hypothetical protein [Cytobacillus praedii]|uniref:Uncharacterized protein n=1 Tax=Cytobacillus praedii TaxID=1742358 RepID=A0A4R1AYP7_9BACI|nr:hypothetical protein [Cytobacillus praedii]MED3553641.1 hypothetical protein [Cytobacillus praedii]TCJ05506.1 hypothetical protein E0Y62_04985 [Cytobacillus praedii]
MNNFAPGWSAYGTRGEIRQHTTSHEDKRKLTGGAPIAYQTSGPLPTISSIVLIVSSLSKEPALLRLYEDDHGTCTFL